MRPEKFIATGVPTVQNFLIIRTEQWNTIHRLLLMCEQEWCIATSMRTTWFSVDMYNINTTMKQKQIKYTGYVWEQKLQHHKQWPVSLVTIAIC